MDSESASSQSSSCDSIHSWLSRDDDNEEVEDMVAARFETKRVNLAIKARKIENDIIKAKQLYEAEARRIKEALEWNAMRYKARQVHLNKKFQIIEAEGRRVMEEHRLKGRMGKCERLASEQAEREKESTRRLATMIRNIYFEPPESPVSLELKLQRLEEDRLAAVAVEDSLYNNLISDDEARRRRIWREIKAKIDLDADARTSGYVAAAESVWNSLCSEGNNWINHVPSETRAYYNSLYREFQPYEQRPGGGKDGSSSHSLPSILFLKKQHVSKEVANSIKRDAHRTFYTFRQHSQMAAFLISRREPQCIEALNNLLLNSAQYFGYCQGINYIGANLLLYHTESDAFILLCYLMHDKNLRVLFDPNSACLVHYIKELERWLKHYHLDMYLHFQDVGFTGYCYAIQWFNTCYLLSNPGNLSKCVIDMLLVNVKDTLLRVGIGILADIKSQLMHLDIDHLQEQFKISVLGVRTVDVLHTAFMLKPPSSLDCEVELLKRLDPATCIYEEEEEEGESEEGQEVEEVAKRYYKRNETQDANEEMNCSDDNCAKNVDIVSRSKLEQAVADFEEELNRLYEEEAKAKVNETANQYLRQLLQNTRNGNMSFIKFKGKTDKNILSTIHMEERFPMGSFLPIISPEQKFEAIKQYDRGFSRSMVSIERLILGVIARKRFDFCFVFKHVCMYVCMYVFVII